MTPTEAIQALAPYLRDDMTADEQERLEEVVAHILRAGQAPFPWAGVERGA